MKASLLSTLTALATLAVVACGSKGASDGGSSSIQTASSGGTHTSTGNEPGGSSSSSGTSTRPNGSSSGSSAGTPSGGSSGSPGGSSSSGASATEGSNGPVLLFDNDGNTSPPSGDTSLQIFENWLNGAGVAYTTYLEPADGDDGSDAGYTYLVADGGSIDGFGTIVFFSGGSNSDDLLGPAQQATLQQWLNAGGHTLILFSPELVYSIGVDDWSSNESNGLLSSDVGASADLDDPNVWLPDAGGDDDIQSTLSTVVTGSSTAPAFTGKQWLVLPTNSSSSVTYDFSVIEPTAGVDILSTIQADPASTNTGNVPAPVALGHRHAGAAGTSTVIWVGFPVEDIGANSAGFNDLGDFFAAVQAYAGLP